MAILSVERLPAYIHIYSVAAACEAPVDRLDETVYSTQVVQSQQSGIIANFTIFCP